MILNLLLIAFVIGMAVMWSTYGLFSALLHLFAVIAAGALAFAFWELWVYKLWLGLAPSLAWGLGLLLPFGVLLIVIRVALDSAVRGNMQFPALANQILGGAVGALSGILTAGITLIGIGFLPLPPAIAGWQPYEVNSIGQVAPREGGALWLGVDRMTAGFYSRLSSGAFASATPLSYYLPQVEQQATVSRLARFYDPNQSTAAHPDEVEITGVYDFRESRAQGVGVQVNDYLNGQRRQAAIAASGQSSAANPVTDAGANAGGASGGNAAGKLIIVETTWKKDGKGTYDSDNNLRIPPTQIRLSIDTGRGPWKLVAPVGFSRPNDAGRPTFYAIQSNATIASALFPEIGINWVFAVPENATPNFLLARNTRLPLPAVETASPADAGPLLGQFYDPSAPADPAAAPAPVAASGRVVPAEPSGYTTHKAIAIDQTDKLPIKISKNRAQFVKANPGKGDAAIISGQGTAGAGTGGRGNSFDRVAVSDSRRGVRIQLGPHTPPPGGTPQGNVQEIWITDSAGRIYRPFAYVLLKSDRRQKMNVLGSGEFRNNTDLPLNELQPGEELYAYWSLPPGIVVEAYHIGSARQPIGFPVQ